MGAECRAVLMRRDARDAASLCQLLVAAPHCSWIHRMRETISARWRDRMSEVSLKDPKVDAVSSTLIWTGMGGTTSPILNEVR